MAELPLLPLLLPLLLPPLLLPPCCCPWQVRERDWANVITCHEGAPAAYTWRLQHFTLGDAVLRPPPDPSNSQQQQQQQQQQAAAVTAVALSPCGNYGLVGTAAGRVDRYNMQSGLHRGTYWRRQQQQQQLNGVTGEAFLLAVAATLAAVLRGSWEWRLVAGLPGSSWSGQGQGKVYV